MGKSYQPGPLRPPGNSLICPARTPGPLGLNDEETYFEPVPAIAGP